MGPIKLKRTYLKSLLLTASLALVNHACTGQLEAPSTATEMPSSAPYIDTGDSIVPVVATTTSKIASSEEILPSMAALVGLKLPSEGTYSAFNNAYRPLLSEDGAADSVNPPMMMSVLNLSGYVCNDLISQEKALASADRQFFIDWDFKKGTATLSPNVISASVHKLARSAWSRNETPDENKLISDAALSITGTKVNDTIGAAIMICTSVLASLDANKR